MRFRGKAQSFDGAEPGFGQPSGNLLRFEAEALVGLLVAERFDLVRGEVYDQETPARRQDARALADRVCGLRKIMQNLMKHDGIGSTCGERYVVDVTVTDFGVGQARRFELAARVGQHRL